MADNSNIGKQSAKEYKMAKAKTSHDICVVKLFFVFVVLFVGAGFLGNKYY